MDDLDGPLEFPYRGVPALVSQFQGLAGQLVRACPAKLVILLPGNLMLARTAGDDRDLDPEQCNSARNMAPDAGLATSLQMRQR